MVRATLALVLAISFCAHAAWVPLIARTAGSAVSRRPLRMMSDSLPEEASKEIPPERLADAWRRDEKAKELADVLKGCSLYLVGVGARKNAIGRVLARRLPRYRYYDIPALMCGSYKAMSQSEEAVTLHQLMASEPLSDVEELSNAVMREVQQFTRSVHVVWDGAVSTANYMVMQQGIVVHLDCEVSEGEVALPSEGGEDVLQGWREGHKKADVTVKIGEDIAADDAAFELVQAVLKFVEANPARSAAWKDAAEASLAAKDDAQQ